MAITRNPIFVVNIWIARYRKNNKGISYRLIWLFIAFYFFMNFMNFMSSRFRFKQYISGYMDSVFCYRIIGITGDYCVMIALTVVVSYLLNWTINKVVGRTIVSNNIIIDKER